MLPSDSLVSPGLLHSLENNNGREVLGYYLKNIPVLGLS